MAKFLIRKPNFGPGIEATIYGWGSIKLENPKKDLLDVPMSTMLREIVIKATTVGPCERILKRKLRKNQICAIGTYTGVSAGQVINFHKTYLLKIFSSYQYYNTI